MANKNQFKDERLENDSSSKTSVACGAVIKARRSAVYDVPKHPRASNAPRDVDIRRRSFPVRRGQASKAETPPISTSFGGYHFKPRYSPFDRNKKNEAGFHPLPNNYAAF